MLPKWKCCSPPQLYTYEPRLSLEYRDHNKMDLTNNIKDTKPHSCPLQGCGSKHVFNILPEGRSQTHPQHCSSRTPILFWPTTGRLVTPQWHSTTQPTSCVGGADPPSHNKKCFALWQPLLQPAAYLNGRGVAKVKGNTQEGTPAPVHVTSTELELLQSKLQA